MGRTDLDASTVLRLAEGAGLPLEAARAEQLAPALAGLFRQAEALRDLTLDDIEPAAVFGLLTEEP